MGITKVLARHWKIHVNTGEEMDNPVWTKVKGLTSIGFGSSKNDADTTTFDSEGVEEHLPASRSYDMSLDGQYLEDQETGERDPGQKFLEELAEKVGPSGLGYFRITSPGGNKQYFMGSVNIEGPSGGNNDPTAWNVAVTVSGAKKKEPLGETPGTEAVNGGASGGEQ